VDQVIGDLDVTHRAEHARSGERVADDQLDVGEAHIVIWLERALHARAVACEGAHVVAPLEQAGEQRRAREAADPGQEDAHRDE
jgi:hypothetical protein